MRSIFFYIALVFPLIASQTSSAQYRPFEKYNFEDGGYTLVGVFEHYTDHKVQKKVGEFYTDDLAVLNAIKKAWNFPKTQRMYACGYHYYLVLMRNGIRVDDLSINLDCNEIVTEKGSRVFSSSLLTSFSSRLKPLFSRSDEFSSVEKAREYWTQIKRNQNFAYAYEPRWLKYEGNFGFRAQCPKGSSDCYMTGRDGKIMATIRDKIASSYPDEKFELRSNGGTSTGEIFFEIQCDKSLESKFDIYDRWDKEAFGKWQPFPLVLRSYWKKN
jgi:hypothetical protein